MVLLTYYYRIKYGGDELIKSFRLQTQIDSLTFIYPNMVLTNPQTTAFFTDAAQMALEPCTRLFLATKGIATVDDLKEFTTSESWKQILQNANYPPQIADPDPANPGHLMTLPPFRISAKSLIRLKVTALAVAYYEDTSCPLTAPSMQGEPRLRSFKAQSQWEAIKRI